MGGAWQDGGGRARGWKSHPRKGEREKANSVERSGEK